MQYAVDRLDVVLPHLRPDYRALAIDGQCETITFHLLANGPMLIEQEEDKSYIYVVTPMRGRQ